MKRQLKRELQEHLDKRPEPNTPAWREWMLKMRELLGRQGARPGPTGPTR